MSMILMSVELLMAQPGGTHESGKLAWAITVLALLLGAGVAVAGGR